MFWLVNLYSLFVYIERNGDESPKDNNLTFAFVTNTTGIFDIRVSGYYNDSLWKEINFLLFDAV